MRPRNETLVGLVILVAAAIVPPTALAQGEEAIDGLEEEVAESPPEDAPVTDEEEAQAPEEAEEPPEQEDPTQRARTLFAEGIECVGTRDFACAEARFREALELHEAVTVRYNLASAVFEQGRYPEAMRLTRSVAGDLEASDELREHAHTLESEIEQRAAMAEIVVSGAPVGAELRIDGEVVPAAEWSAVPVAPGTRRFSVHVGDELLTERSEAAVAGAPLLVELHIVPMPVEVEPEPEPAPEESAEQALLHDPIFWVAVGGGVVLLTTLVLIVAVLATNGVEDPIPGDYEPGVLTWD